MSRNQILPIAALMATATVVPLAIPTPAQAAVTLPVSTCIIIGPDISVDVSIDTVNVHHAPTLPGEWTVENTVTRRHQGANSGEWCVTGADYVPLIVHLPGQRIALSANNPLVGYPYVWLKDPATGHLYARQGYSEGHTQRLVAHGHNFLIHRGNDTSHKNFTIRIEN